MEKYRLARRPAVDKAGAPGAQPLQIAGVGAQRSKNFAKKMEVASAQPVVARVVKMGRTAALADDFYRALLALPASAFFAAEGQTGRAIHRLSQRAVVELAEMMPVVNQVIAGVEPAVGLHHQVAAAAGGMDAGGAGVAPTPAQYSSQKPARYRRVYATGAR